MIKETMEKEVATTINEDTGIPLPRVYGAFKDINTVAFFLIQLLVLTVCRCPIERPVTLQNRHLFLFLMRSIDNKFPRQNS
jgi:hypothetical protein